MDFFINVGNILAKYWSYILSGIGFTMLIALVGTLIGLVIGLLAGIIRTIPESKNTALRILQKMVSVIISVYVEVFRGTPMMVQAMVIFWGYAFMNGGLASRMKKAAERARCADELYALAATKVYTNSRIRRAALCTVCRIPDAVRRSSPEYLSLLCANGKGREFLSRRSSAIPVLTTVREKKAYASFEYEMRLDSLFETVRKFDGGKRLYTFPPVML